MDRKTSRQTFEVNASPMDCASSDFTVILTEYTDIMHYTCAIYFRVNKWPEN